MSAPKTKYNVLYLILVAVIVWGFASTMLTGCATTGTTSTTTSAEDLAREKAIKDSLDNIYKRKLMIAWSTGAEYRKAKNYESAIPAFQKVVEQDTISLFPDVYSFLGECYFKINNADSALMMYQMGREKAPEKTQNHRMAGYLLSLKQENEEAIDAYYKAVELSEPARLSDLKPLASLLVKEDRIEEALEVYEQIIQLDPNDATSQNVYSELLKSTGDEDAVIEAKEEALAMNPDDTRTMFVLGEMYFKRAEFKKSVEKLDMLLAKQPDDVMAMELKGNAQQNLEQYSEAIKTYDAILAKDAENKKIICEKATCYKELGQLGKARSVANQALKIDSNYGLAHIVIGDVYTKAADKCIGKRDKRVVNFDDKLVYELAYNSYQKAKKDIMFSDIAARNMEYISQDIPTKQDRFMNPDKSKATLECYKWIY